MTAPVPPPYRPQHTGPYAAPGPQDMRPYVKHMPPYAPQHLAPLPYPPYPPTSLVTSTPHVIRGDRNGMGTAGLVVAILSLITATVPLVGLVAWGMWPVGAALSGVGLARANRELATNRSTALAGLIVSLTAAAVCIGWVVFTAYTQAAYR